MLSKKPPLDQPWPAGPELAKALARFEPDKNPPPRTRVFALLFPVSMAVREGTHTGQAP